MRKFTGIVLCIAMGACMLTACSSEEKDKAPVAVEDGQTSVAIENQSGNNGSEAGNTVAATIFDFEYNGTVVALGNDPFNVVDALGEYQKFESVSCAFQGTDYVFQYSSFIIRSSPNPEGKDVIVSIELLDDTVQTTNGLYIGMTKDDVVAEMGTPIYEMPGGIEYYEGNKLLDFFITDDVVVGINYTFVNE